MPWCDPKNRLTLRARGAGPATWPLVLGVVAAVFAGGCGKSDGKKGASGTCPGEALAGDLDGDGVSDELDRCPGFDDSFDEDGDGVPGGCDLCPSADDAEDADGDGLPDSCDDDPAVADWVRTATVGGASLFWEARRLEIEAILNELKQQNVSVVEGDSDLSLYLDDDEFERELTLIQSTAELAHERGMRLVWYYPTLEVISADGRISDTSMFKDNPDWVQRSIDGEPNVFYGDLAFWVDPDAESAWMDPLTPYRDYFLDRIRLLAATDLDGLWLDVPLLNDIVGVWPSHTPEAKARFAADTGHEAPTAADPEDPVWWIWLDWRHKMVAEFLDDIYKAAREVDPDFQIIVENVTLDYNSSILQGLDGTFSRERDGFAFVWEVDVTSESDGMIFASPDDWIALIAMMKFGRGALPDTPSWAFTYGNVVDDAEMVMAEALATQNNPYELKAPEMTTTVGGEYRARMFEWIQTYSDLLFRSRSAAKIAVIQSSASRDYVDGSCMIQDECGVGLYATTSRPSALDSEATWWSEEAIESIYSTGYLADYRGLVKALVHLHRPFDVIPLRRATASELARYSAVLVPDLQAVSTEQAELLAAYVEGGGRALFTGPDPGARTEVGLHLQNPLADLLDLQLASGCSEQRVGSGAATRCVERLGKSYFDGGSADSLATIDEFLSAAAPAEIETDAPDNVHFELYRREGRLILHVVNFTGADGQVRVNPQQFHVSLDVSELESDVCRVVSLSPRAGASLVPYSMTDGRLEFDLDVDIYEMIVVSP